MVVPMYICLTVKSGAEALCTEHNRSSGREAVAPTPYHRITRIHIHHKYYSAQQYSDVRRSIIRFVHQFSVFILLFSGVV